MRRLRPGATRSNEHVRRARAAWRLGRPRRGSQVVHHVNGDPPDNLAVVSSQRGHMLLHPTCGERRRACGTCWSRRRRFRRRGSTCCASARRSQGDGRCCAERRLGVVTRSEAIGDQGIIEDRAPNPHAERGGAGLRHLLGLVGRGMYLSVLMKGRNAKYIGLREGLEFCACLCGRGSLLI